MKNHKRNKDFTLPGEVAEICGFKPDETLGFRVEKGLLVAAPASMTAMQTVRAIDALTCLAAEFLGKLKDACGPCGGCPDGCPYEGVYGPEAELSEEIHRGCPMRAQRSGSHGGRRSDGAGELSAGRRKRASAVRDDAGVPEGHKLHVEVCGGVAHVSDGGLRHDITDVPPAVRRMLEDIGACAGSLDDLMVLDGEVVCHG